MENYIKAGNIHKEVQAYAREITIHGANLLDIANQIENRIRELTHYDSLHPLKAGVAFPTGLSVNECAAHWTPNPGDTSVIYNDQDLIKVDFGIQIDGCIIDGAISITKNAQLVELVSVADEANMIAIKASGVDAHVYDIGCAVQEFIESSEITIGTQRQPLHSISDLCGHQIGKYKIHAGKPVPNVRFDAIKNDDRYKMKVGEIYALEPYPTTGSGNVMTERDLSKCSHYMANYMVPSKFNDKIIRKSQIVKDINNIFSTLAFCKRWLPGPHVSKISALVSQGIYCAYPPLYSEPGTYVAQTEKTICVLESGGVLVLN